ncbi:MAG: 3D domain-containing protein [Filifactoraceae bacterium]
MKRILGVMLIMTVVLTIGTIGVFGDYTAQFGAMNDNISKLELKVQNLDDLLATNTLSDDEIIATKLEIEKANEEIEIYQTSMETLESLSKPVSEKTNSTEKTTGNSKEMTYVGNFKLTGYCPCQSCSEGWGTQTSSGRKATAGVTVAASKQFPIGTKLYIEGVGYRTVDDRGGAIKGNKIDVFVNSHSECYNPAYNATTKVYIVK